MKRESSKHLVNPELWPMLAAFPTVEITPNNFADLRRAALAPLPFDYGGDTASVTVGMRTVPGLANAPSVALRIYRPQEFSAPGGCIFHIHGGGFVSGSAAVLDSLHRSLVAQLRCQLISVDYRLAPETPFPGAIEDCYAGFAWVSTHTDELGIDPERIGVMGESAGGGLAAALALLARDRAEHRVAFQHLMYPMLDDRTCTAANANPYAGEFLWTPHNNQFGWSALLNAAPGDSTISPYAAPARATELSRLPPTFLATGALDLFVEENLEYARRLMHAGVAVELHVYAGAVHGFDLVPTTEIASRSRRETLAALARALASPAPGRAE